MDLAITHYLNKYQRSESPLFCFMSLYSDDELYPLDEVVTCLNERIKGLEQAFKLYPTDSLAITLDRLRRQRMALVAIEKQNR